MAGKNKTADLLPASSMAKKKAAAFLSFLPYPAVELVCRWALTFVFAFACAKAIVFVLNLTYHHQIPCSQSAVVLRCVELTDTQAAQETDLWTGMLWCVMVQVAVAVPALLLPRRRRWIRRALAYVALSATMVAHYMFTSACGIFLAADPGDLFFRIFCSTAVFMFAAADLLCLLALLLGGDEED